MATDTIVKDLIFNDLTRPGAEMPTTREPEQLYILPDNSLEVITHDNTLTGEGTTQLPLKVSETITTKTDKLTFSETDNSLIITANEIKLNVTEEGGTTTTEQLITQTDVQVMLKDAGYIEQVTSLPDITEDIYGKIVQYVGPTMNIDDPNKYFTSTLITGGFYECKEYNLEGAEGEDNPETIYLWTLIDTNGIPEQIDNDGKVLSTTGEELEWVDVYTKTEANSTFQKALTAGSNITLTDNTIGVSGSPVFDTIATSDYRLKYAAVGNYGNMLTVQGIGNANEATSVGGIAFKNNSSDIFTGIITSAPSVVNEKSINDLTIAASNDDGTSSCGIKCEMNNTDNKGRVLLEGVEFTGDENDDTIATTKWIRDLLTEKVRIVSEVPAEKEPGIIYLTVA